MTMINKEKLIARFDELIEGAMSNVVANSYRSAKNIVNQLATVEQYTITNPDDYEELFGNMIYELLTIMCDAKGIENDYCNDMTNEIMESIIKIANNWHMDLSIPQKEYHVGDKVTIYFEGQQQQATIVNVGYEKYALLLNAKNNVILISDGVDSATSYIYYLQHNTGYNVE